MREDLGLLLLRFVTGGLLAGHGVQKTFGWFGGPGPKGTAGWVESLGLKPGNVWGTAAGLAETGGGTLTALGLFHPLGPISEISAMSMATVKAHWGKPIWASRGGAELPMINIATALTLILTGPGAFSLDTILGIRLPRWLVALAVVVSAAGFVWGVMSRPAPAPSAQGQAGAKTETRQATTA